jgi:hypothetical protein
LSCFSGIITGGKNPESGGPDKAIKVILCQVEQIVPDKKTARIIPIFAQ